MYLTDSYRQMNSDAKDILKEASALRREHLYSAKLIDAYMKFTDETGGKFRLEDRVESLERFRTLACYYVDRYARDTKDGVSEMIHVEMKNVARGLAV